MPWSLVELAPLNTTGCAPSGANVLAVIFATGGLPATTITFCVAVTDWFPLSVTVNVRGYTPCPA